MCVESDREDDYLDLFLSFLSGLVSVFLTLSGFRALSGTQRTLRSCRKTSQCFYLLLLSVSTFHSWHGWQSIVHCGLLSQCCGSNSMSVCFFQCGLYSEYDKGDWQLFPGVLHLHEHQSVWCGGHRPAQSLARHIQLHQHCKVLHPFSPNL